MFFRELRSYVDLPLTPAQEDLLFRHFTLLLRWNQKMNLTSIRDPAEIVKRHFAESLFLVRFLDPRPRTLVDIGSGPGFPGFPLAVALPDVQVTLVESISKKAAFLKEISRGVPNVEVVNARFESLDRHFDVATIRAVSLPPALSSKVDAFLHLTTTRESPADATPLPWEPGRSVSRGTFLC